MNVAFYPEGETIARIESLELEVRETRRRLEHARSESDKKVLNKQLGELKDEIQYLSNRLKLNK
ncbi:MAG TPA: hypothetical protein VHD56_00950 [Tepidisphaeraceae bacterium]|nr:hypothetical protein [Tepidisphaeraceae bacterium]